MAGRPLSMAKRVTALEERAFELAVGLCSARPAQYEARQGSEGDDELCKAWNVAAGLVERASIAVAHLLTLFEERAGLPWDQLELRREQERGLLPWEEVGAKPAGERGDEPGEKTVEKGPEEAQEGPT